MKIVKDIIAVMRIIITCMLLICNATSLLSQNVCDIQSNDTIVVPKIMTDGVKSFQCNFVENKMIQSLNESFISEGMIRYTPTETVIEYIKPEQIVIKKNANDITVSSNDETIKTNTFHKQIITSIENIFKGDIDEVIQNYSVTATDDSAQYIIKMTAQKKSRIESLELYLDKSDNNAINKIIIKEARGNIITITVSERNVIM